MFVLCHRAPLSVNRHTSLRWRNPGDVCIVQPRVPAPSGMLPFYTIRWSFISRWTQPDHFQASALSVWAPRLSSLTQVPEDSLDFHLSSIYDHHKNIFWIKNQVLYQRNTVREDKWVLFFRTDGCVISGVKSCCVNTLFVPSLNRTAEPNVGKVNTLKSICEEHIRVWVDPQRRSIYSQRWWSQVTFYVETPVGPFYIETFQGAPWYCTVLWMQFYFFIRSPIELT